MTASILLAKEASKDFFSCTIALSLSTILFSFLGLYPSIQFPHFIPKVFNEA